jgi:hypothetical protein
MDLRFGPGAVVVTNYGVPGTIASQAPRVSADVVVANFGINDGLHGESLADFSTAMRSIGATLIETQSPVSAYFGNKQADYVATARGLGLPVADTYSYVSKLPTWRAMEPDQIHPVDALYRQIVVDVLAPAVGSQVAPLRCLASMS